MIVKTLRKIKRKVYRQTEIIDISHEDEYIAWLCFANAGMLPRGNLYCLDYAVKNLPSANPVVEIGTFCGLSANAITYYLQRAGETNKVVSSDKWVFEGVENGPNLGRSAVSHAAYRDFVKESYMRNVKMFSSYNVPYMIEEFSDDFFRMWSEGRQTVDVFGREIKLGGQISFCYIDGNHSYEYAKRDFENTDKFLEKGGFILFDDAYDGSIYGCAELMKEIIKNEKYRLVIKNPNYLFRKVK